MHRGEALRCAVALLALAGCGRLSGFEDFTAAPASGGAGMAGVGGQAGSTSGLPGWPSTCFDNEKNGDETAINCGGSCPPCGRGQGCVLDRDCSNGDCVEGLGLCSDDCPPTMTEVVRDDLNPPQKLCMDTYEVTQADYAAYLLNSPSRDRQDPVCAQLNGSFWPATRSPRPDVLRAPCTDNTFRPKETPDLPVACVDHCDAAAYCREHGWFLCGDSDKPGQTIADLNGFRDGFYLACASLTERRYPYGDDYDIAACNDKNNTFAAGLDDVDADATCATPGLSQERIFDLVGNAAEWSAYCQEGVEPQQCAVRGGSYRDGPPTLYDNTGQAWCRGVVFLLDTDTFADVGFRCCG